MGGPLPSGLCTQVQFLLLATALCDPCHVDMLVVALLMLYYNWLSELQSRLGSLHPDLAPRCSSCYLPPCFVSLATLMT